MQCTHDCSTDSASHRLSSNFIFTTGLLGLTPYLSRNHEGRVQRHTQVDQAVLDLANTEGVPALILCAKLAHILITAGGQRQVLHAHRTLIKQRLAESSLD